jgi:hypothetical protein
MILISSFAALLAASGTQSANAVQRTDQDAWAQYYLACADAGIDPGSAAFNQCVIDLNHALWALRNLYKS